MAIIDYGAIAWKNGKLISTDMFTDMKDMVGWSDNGEHGLEGGYFAYVGDKDLTLAFYKTSMRIYHPTFSYDNDTIFFGSEQFEGWKKWGMWTTSNHKDAKIIVKPKRFHDYYVCHMRYNGDKYKVAFGYGVDLGYYKKYYIIDYYGTPWFQVKSLYRDFKYWLQDIRWRYKK